MSIAEDDRFFCIRIPLFSGTCMKLRAGFRPVLYLSDVMSLFLASLDMFMERVATDKCRNPMRSAFPVKETRPSSAYERMPKLTVYPRRGAAGTLFLLNPRVQRRENRWHWPQHDGTGFCVNTPVTIT